jgi:hypothetical protein
MVIMAIKTGTHRFENQISARRMKAITGVDLSTTRIGLRNEKKFGEVPAKIPVMSATTRAIMNPNKPRATVAETE